MEQRGFSVQTVESISEARAHIGVSAPAFAVLDMRLEDGSGLDMVDLIHAKRPDCKVVLLTGYGNLATAVSAITENPMSADRVRWEHIQRVYELCGKNVSETARRLNMHRRTLQRILAKRAPR